MRLNRHIELALKYHQEKAIAFAEIYEAWELTNEERKIIKEKLDFHRKLRDAIKLALLGDS